MGVEELRRQQIEREAEVEAQRKLCLELISAGYKGLAVKLHPDKGGSLVDMTRLVTARDRLLETVPSNYPPQPGLREGPNLKRATWSSVNTGYKHMLMRNTTATGKRTIAQSDDAVVRCPGRLSCECGTPVKASDIDIDVNHDNERVHMRLVCSGCHADLLEVEGC